MREEEIPPASDAELRAAIREDDEELRGISGRMREIEIRREPFRSELRKREKARNIAQEEHEKFVKATAKLIPELRPVFEAAARVDQPLVEYHGRRLGVELLPLHGREVR